MAHNTYTVTYTDDRIKGHLTHGTYSTLREALEKAEMLATSDLFEHCFSPQINGRDWHELRDEARDESASQ